MNRVASHVVVIIITGIVIGFILRSRNLQQTEENRAAAQREALAATNVSPDSGPTVIVGDGWLSEFELTERSGEKVSSEQLLGAPYIVSFFFTTCPSTCSRQNDHVKILQEEFRDSPVRLLSISCDPEIDTPEVLSEYAKRYEADDKQWLFLTGDLNYIRRVGAEVFRLHVDYRVHTDRFILVDPKGEIASVYEWPEPSQFDQLKVDLKKMLAGEPIGKRKNRGG